MSPSRRRSLAQSADKYALYQAAVQAPDYDVAFLDRVGLRHSGRIPSRLREDFCGTALVSCRWVARRPGNEAWAIDIDPAPLEWGRRHNAAELGSAASRLHLIQGDVLAARTPACDAVLAPNFSFCCFQDRATLLAYFKAARRALKPGGLLVADMFGGPEAMEVLTESRRVKSFTYVWEQSAFDPIASRLRAHIGFRFKDGSELRRAFTYDWRLWTLPELRDLLQEAGFASSHVYWELTGRDGRGTGVFRLMERTSATDSFVCCLVAVR